MSPTDRSAWSWRESTPELGIAIGALLAAGIAGYVVAGVRAMVLAVVVFTAIALLVMLGFVSAPLPSGQPEPEAQRHLSGSAMHLRLRTELVKATRSLGSYNTVLRPRLVHLLAARLAEHHGVNLYRQPKEARTILCAGGRDNELWAWVDPSIDAATDGPDAAGIPQHTLWRLIARLEEL
jgi:hypothetical protein